MKKVLSLIGLMLLATLVFAQATPAKLSFGAKIADVEAGLLNQGYLRSYQEENYFEYSAPKNTNNPKFSIFTDRNTKCVTKWIMEYNLTNSPELHEKVLQSLIDLFGEYSVKSDYGYDYIWYFTDNKALYVTINSKTNMLLDYDEGNWDDDDFDYYFEDY